MTLDDDSSIYVGGLPYDATEDTIRTVFNLYGAILDVKIINDQRTVGKCYCFVTFTNPRSAIDAINDMNGRSISGRVVKVNGVKSRGGGGGGGGVGGSGGGGGGGGGRSNFGRERYYHHNDDRNGDWDRGRDREIRDQDYERGSGSGSGRGRDIREQNYDHGNEKDGYRSRGGDWTRHGDRSRDRDRSRDLDRSRDHERGRDRKVEHVQDYDDQARENISDDDWNRDDDKAENQQENSRVHGVDVDRDHNLDVDTDRKIDRVSDPDKSFDEPKREQSRRNIDLNVTNQNSSSDSADDHNDEVEDELEQSMQGLDQLKKEVSKLEERVEERRLNVMELQKHSKKLEDATITAKKQSLYRQMQLTKLHECFLQVQDSKERLKTSEKEFQALVDSVMFESDGDGSLGQLTNGSLDVESAVAEEAVLFSKTNSTNVSPMSSSYVKTQGGYLCRCQGRMISYQCKKGPKKGKLFWRCPFWRGDDTCDLFIWDEDMVAKSGNEYESNMNGALGYLKELYEDLKKKNKSLKNKLKAEKCFGKMKMLLIVISFMFSVSFCSNVNVEGLR